MTTWAIVPVKPLYRSKSRLSSVLSPNERKTLSRNMLEHTLDVLSSSALVDGILMVSRDPEALSIARARNVNTVQESGSPELNAALTRASKVCAATWNAKRVLVLPSDLPLLTSQDVEAILTERHYPSEVVIAPDRRDDGTNALLLKPPALFEFAFGPASFATHLERAASAGATVNEYRSPTVALDLDLPEDLELYRAAQAAG